MRTHLRKQASRQTVSALGRGQAPVLRLRPGQVACPVCHNGTTPLPTGFLRTHCDPSGYPCANRKAP